jgi:sulfoxide reductase heme-binding subunit YedZ
MLARAWQALGRLLAALVNWRFFKPAVFVACLYPGAELGWRLWRFIDGTDFSGLGVNPNETLLHETGITALTILLLTLSVTPLRRIFKINRLQGVRRMLGVWAFVYAALHLTSYLVFDQLCYSLETCDFRTIWQDILKRRFIFVGQTAFAILLVLAITSTTGWQRRLRKNWQRLHRLVYVAAVAAIVHFIWIQKSDYSEPFRWGAWLLALLAIRGYFAIRNRRRLVTRGVEAPSARVSG